MSSVTCFFKLLSCAVDILWTLFESYNVFVHVVSSSVNFVVNAEKICKVKSSVA